MERQSGFEKGDGDCGPKPDETTGRSSRRLLIKNLCLRDVSYIAANMRQQDFEEISCLWEVWDTRALGVCAMETAVPGMVWSVWYEGQPAAAFGFSRGSAFDPEHWQAWAFGTDRFKRCVPLMTRHMVTLRPQIERSCRRLQVISLAGHDVAHRWIEKLGAEKEGRFRAYGRGGEDFWVYSWVRDRRVAVDDGNLPRNCGTSTAVAIGG